MEIGIKAEKINHDSVTYGLTPTRGAAMMIIKITYCESEQYADNFDGYNVNSTLLLHKKKALQI